MYTPKILPKFLDEIRSIAFTFISTTIAILAVDGFDILSLIYSGDISKPVLLSLLMALLRSSIKAILQMIFPKLFKYNG